MEILNNCGVFTNILSPSDLKKLMAVFNNKPYTVSTSFNDTSKGKYSDLYNPKSIVSQIILPKLKTFIGNNDIEASSFLERTAADPIPLHVDSSKMLQHNYAGLISSPVETQQSHMAVLFPLVSNENLKTIVFDIVSDIFPMDSRLEPFATVDDNGLDVNDFTHLAAHQQKYITNIPIKTIYTWNSGDGLWWDRRLVHCSPSYKDLSLIKRSLVIFFN